MGKTNKNKTEDLNTVPFKNPCPAISDRCPLIDHNDRDHDPVRHGHLVSLTNYSFKLPSHKFIGLKNWVEVLSSDAFWNALKFLCCTA